MAAPLTTTVIGSYTVPDWYPALQEAVAAGKLPPEAFRDAKAVAARAAVKDQEAAGGLTPVPLGLVEELSSLRQTTNRPVKIAMTGPHMFARVACDEYYRKPEALAMDMAAGINTELRRLDEAGCDVIQLDEPILWFLADDQPGGLLAVNTCFP